MRLLYDSFPFVGIYVKIYATEVDYGWDIDQLDWNTLLYHSIPKNEWLVPTEKLP